MRELKAGLKLLQQPYSKPVADHLFQHLEAAAGHQKAAYMQQEATSGRRQGTGTYMVQVLQLVEECMQWLLPALVSGQAASTDISSGHSSSSGDAGDEFPVHLSCMARCQQISMYMLSSAQLAGEQAAAAMSSHLRDPCITGEVNCAVQQPRGRLAAPSMIHSCQASGKVSILHASTRGCGCAWWSGSRMTVVLPTC
jgi:hypothetical protein